MADTWAQTQRQEWIKEMLQIYGFINRDHIKRKFWVSTPQASKDLQDFIRDNPKACIYNSAAKRYERTKP